MKSTAEVVQIKDAKWKDLFDGMREYIQMQEKNLVKAERENRSLKKRLRNLQHVNIDTTENF